MRGMKSAALSVLLACILLALCAVILQRESPPEIYITDSTQRVFLANFSFGLVGNARVQFNVHRQENRAGHVYGEYVYFAGNDEYNSGSVALYRSKCSSPNDVEQIETSFVQKWSAVGNLLAMKISGQDKFVLYNLDTFETHELHKVCAIFPVR